MALAAGASGVQNAMASTYANLVLRTTHITGVATDLGLLLGRLLRTGRVEIWKLGLSVTLLVGFMGGGLAGWAAGQQVGVRASLTIVAMTLLVLSGIYRFAIRVRRRGA